MRSPTYGAYRFTRVAGSDAGRAPISISPLQEGWVSPAQYSQDGDVPVWAAAADPAAAADAKARLLRRADPRGARRRRSGPAGARPQFETQSIDPMFLEPECGLAWYDAGTARTSSSCSACSRPTRRRSRVAHLLGEADAAIQAGAHQRAVRLCRRRLRRRDHTPFPLYVALAAMFFPGRPVRLAHDRYQQFQARHQAACVQDAARGSASIARAARSSRSPPTMCSTAAGWPTIRPASPSSAPTGAIGIYDIPKVDVTTVAVHSRGVTAGSMRGYGTLQTMTALEVLVDEAAPRACRSIRSSSAAATR